LSDNDGILLGEIQKKEKVLRYSIREYNGNKYLDIRVFFINGQGLRIPTKEGITIGVKHLQDHVKFLNEARRRLLGDPF
jgi:hypothetical protein